MAGPITYEQTPTKIHPSAHDELGELLQALHERGLLRLATLLVEGGADALSVILERAYTPQTKASLNVLAQFATLPGKLPDDLLIGIGRGAQGTRSALKSKRAPSLVQLIRLLLDPEVRRGLGVTIALVKGLGSLTRNDKDV